MRLIDPIELKRAISVAAMSNNHKTLEQIIDEQPSAQPEIIRCKDCTRFDKKRGCNLVEGLNIARADSFCSYGERREEKR